MKSKYKIWKTVTLGEKPDLQDINISSWAQDLLDKTTYSTKKEKIDLVKITLSDWFTQMPTTTEIYAKAKKEGLELCPSQVGPQLRVVYKDQTLNEWICIAMKPIAVSGGNPHVFGLYRVGGGTWLYAAWADPDVRWDLGLRFVFRRKSLRPSVSVVKLSPSDTLTLRVTKLEKIVNRITKLEKRLDKLTKI